MKELKKLKIVEEVMKMFNLGEEGKLGSFFETQAKILKREITIREHNKKTLELEYSGTFEQLTDDIEDAKEAVENAYKQVDVTKITTNSDQVAYGKEYWDTIEYKETELEKLLKQSKEIAEEHENRIKAINKEIAEYQYRINKIK